MGKLGAMGRLRVHNIGIPLADEWIPAAAGMTVVVGGRSVATFNLQTRWPDNVEDGER